MPDYHRSHSEKGGGAMMDAQRLDLELLLE